MPSDFPPPSKSRMDPIMRRAMGCRVGLLLLMFVDLFVEVRNAEDDGVTSARVVGLLNVAGDWNADACAIVRPMRTVREMGAIVYGIVCEN